MERFRKVGVHDGAHRTGVWTIAPSPCLDASSFVTGGADGAIRLWRLKDGSTPAPTDDGGDDAEPAPPVIDSGSPLSLTATLRHHALGVVSAAVATSTTAGVSTGLDGTVRLWDVSAPDGTHADPAHADAPASRASAARSVMGLKGTSTEAWHVGMSADGARAAVVGGAGSVQVVDVEKGVQAAELLYADAKASDATAGDANAGEAKASDPKTMCLCVDLTGGGERAAVGAQDGTLRVFDVGAEEAGAAVATTCGAVRAVAFVPGDEHALVACGDDGLVVYVDVRSGAVATVLRGHAGMVLCARPSACGGYAASGGTDCAVRVWDRRKAEAAYVGEHEQPVWGVAYVAGGGRLLSGGDDDRIAVLDCEQADVVTA